MLKKRFSSVAEQVAQVLRDGLRQGRWRGSIPGRNRLAAELGVNHKTVTAALEILEKEGLLASRGAGREREIVGGGEIAPSSLRVAILLYDPASREMHYIVELRNQLAEAGHPSYYAASTMFELGMKVSRIARMVEQTEADAWVVLAGARDVLEWFAARPTPALALFGRHMEVPMASTSLNKTGAMYELVERLVSLGHHRIVMLVHEERRKPHPAAFERLFLEKLESHGIRTGAYNLPDWENRPEELQRIIDSLFLHSPPTALIIDDTLHFFAVQQHLARLGFAAPGQVSLVCMDATAYFEWCRPTIAHIAWNHRPLVKRVVDWANHVSRGMDDRRKTICKARFVDGGTIGPVGAQGGLPSRPDANR